MSSPDPGRFVPVSHLYGSVARLLRGAALALALLFVLRVLLTLAPLRSGPLAVLLRLCEALVTQAPFAVLVVCLIGLSLLIDEECPSSRRLARGLRAAALPLALTYLLLIPLYGTAQWWRSRTEVRVLRQDLRSSLQQLGRTRRNLEHASSAQQLERIWASLPAGSPPLSRFGSTPQQQRNAVLRFLDQLDAILQTRLNGVEQRLLLAVARSTALYALACLSLAALFHRSSQLDLPGRRRATQAAGSAASQRWRRSRGPLDQELERLLKESGALEAAATDPWPASGGPDPAADSAAGSAHVAQGDRDAPISTRLGAGDASPTAPTSTGAAGPPPRRSGADRRAHQDSTGDGPAPPLPGSTNGGDPASGDPPAAAREGEVPHRRR